MRSVWIENENVLLDLNMSPFKLLLWSFLFKVALCLCSYCVITLRCHSGFLLHYRRIWLQMKGSRALCFCWMLLVDLFPYLFYLISAVRPTRNGLAHKENKIKHAKLQHTRGNLHTLKHMRDAAASDVAGSNFSISILMN